MTPKNKLPAKRHGRLKMGSQNSKERTPPGNLDRSNSSQARSMGNVEVAMPARLQTNHDAGLSPAQRTLQRPSPLQQRRTAGSTAPSSACPTIGAAKAARANPAPATDDTPTPSAKVKTEKAFDPRANDDSSSDDDSADGDSDDENEPNPAFYARLNGAVAEKSSPRNGITPSKRAPRGKQDEVADSDTERTASKKKAGANGAVSKKKDDTTSSSEESDSEDSNDSSESESEEATKPTKATTQKTTKKPDTSSSSAESDSNSDSDSDSDSDADTGTKQAAKSLMNGKKAATEKPASTSSSEADSDDSSSDEEAAPVPAKAAPKKAATTKAAVTKAADTSSSDEDSTSTSAESASKEKDQAGAVVPARKDAVTAASTFIGNDFVLRQVQGEKDGKDIADLLSTARLDGKQLWYFTAPASVPINVIEKLEVPVNKITNGEPVFEHDGAQYGMSLSREAAANASYQVLIPNKKGDQYQTVSRDVDQVMRIKRVINVSNPGPGPALPRGPRAQPKGLQARFRPLGVPPGEAMGTIGAGSDDDDEQSDVEMADASAPPSTGKKSKAAKQTKKQQDSEPAPAKKAASAKKASKRKLDDNNDEELASTQLMQEEESAEKKKTKKQKRDELSPATPKASHKVTPVAPPSVPVSSQKRKAPEASPELPTPAPKSSKKNKRVSFPAEPSSSQAVPKESPVPIPGTGRQQSAVPIPQVPHVKSPPLEASAADSTPKPKKEKKKKVKETPVAPPSVGRVKSKK